MCERHHPAIAGATRGVEVGGVHHPGADRAEQPDIVFSRFFEALEPQVHHDVGADLAVQRDDRRDIFEVEDEHGLAADLPEHDILGGDVTDRRHHAALPALENVGRFVLVVEAVRLRPGLAATAQSAPTIDIDVQEHRRTHETECGQREPERDHCRLAYLQVAVNPELHHITTPYRA